MLKTCISYKKEWFSNSPSFVCQDPYRKLLIELVDEGFDSKKIEEMAKNIEYNTGRMNLLFAGTKVLPGTILRELSKKVFDGSPGKFVHSSFDRIFAKPVGNFVKIRNNFTKRFLPVDLEYFDDTPQDELNICRLLPAGRDG